MATTISFQGLHVHFRNCASCVKAKHNIQCATHQKHSDFYCRNIVKDIQIYRETPLKVMESQTMEEMSPKCSYPCLLRESH